MLKKDVLCELIKSLNSNEKRYFSLFASRHTLGEKNIYLRLFKAISRQKEYNEVPLLALFKKSTAKENLRLARQYLYKLILKSLHSYHADDSIETQLKNQVHCIKILSQKGLYKHCEKLLKKAKQTAVKYEKHLLLLEILQWEKQLIRFRVYTNKTEDKLDILYMQTYQQLEAYKTINEYEQFFLNLIVKINQKGFTKNRNDMIKYFDNKNKYLLSTYENTNLPLRAKLYLLLYNAVYSNRIEGNSEKAYKYFIQQKHLLEKNKLLLEEENELYIRSLSNLINIQLTLKKYDEMDNTIQKMKSIDTKYKYFRHLIFYSTYLMEITKWIDKGEFEKAVGLIPVIENHPVTDELNQEDRLVMYYEFCNAYFGCKQYKQANFYLNKILNESKQNVRNDIQCFAQILHLIIHFEKDNRDLIEYKVTSATRFLQKRKRIYPSEKVILDFFRKILPKISTNKEQTNAFKTFKTNIEEIITNEPSEKRILDYFDFISWIDSKIEARPFAEVVKGKLVKSL